MTTCHRKTLRAHLAGGKPLLVPGAYDALSARLIEQAGFETLIVSGFGVSASLLGAPDVELYTLPENVAVARNIANAVAVPVMADADNGYGNAINVMRTVREFEQAGVAALTLEDQDSPKRCPLIGEAGNRISIAEATGKIRAAVRARTDTDLVLVARTDARDEEEVIARAQAYAEAGADMIKLISPAVRSIGFLEAVRQACGKPLMVSNLGWMRSQTHASVAHCVGVITEPLLPLFTAAKAMQENLRALRAGVAPDNLPMSMVNQQQFEDIVDLPGIKALEQAYIPS